MSIIRLKDRTDLLSPVRFLLVEEVNVTNRVKTSDILEEDISILLLSSSGINVQFHGTRLRHMDVVTAVSISLGIFFTLSVTKRLKQTNIVRPNVF